MMGRGTGYLTDELTNEQKLDQIPIDEIIQYVVNNYYDQVKEAIQEQWSGY